MNTQRDINISVPKAPVANNFIIPENKMDAIEMNIDTHVEIAHQEALSQQDKTLSIDVKPQISEDKVEVDNQILSAGGDKGTKHQFRIQEEI